MRTGSREDLMEKIGTKNWRFYKECMAQADVHFLGETVKFKLRDESSQKLNVMPCLKMSH